MAFADIDFYKNQYLGNKISDTDLPRLLERAAEHITALTFQRVTNETMKDLTKYETLIKKANCSVAEILQNLEQQQGKTSEGTGNWSISWNTEKDYKEDIYKTVSMYLQRTGLLYAGVDICVESNNYINK